MSEPRVIDYFFTLQSPWAFIGHARLLAIARRHAARIVYRPLALGEVFQNSGGLPLARRHPSRQAYRMVELKRWRARLGMDFHLEPTFWPFAPAQADRVTLALLDLGQRPEPWVSRAFKAVWQDELDLADPGTIMMLLSECGADAEAVMDHASAETIVRRYAENGRDGLALGVFGSPTYMLAGEPFWGQDRLDLLDEALAEGRLPILP